MDEIMSIPPPDDAHSSPGGVDRLLYVGVFCKGEDTVRRNLIRQTNKLLAPPGVDVHFVVCDTAALEGKPEAALWAEMQMFDDIYLLDCTENMDQGKSYDYWMAVKKEHPGYMYYMKADSDSYILYHNLALALRHAPRHNLYFGHPVAYTSKPVYMAGMGYLLSQDLVDTIGQCGKRCYDARKGPEDMRVGDWLNMTLSEPAYLADVSSVAFHIHRLAPEWELISPFVLIIHELKNDVLWFEAHRRLHALLTPSAVRESKRMRNWVTGPRTTMPRNKTGKRRRHKTAT